MTLSDVREPAFGIVWEPCGRRGRHNLERLIAKDGADARLPDLLATLANCKKARSASIYDRCKAVYERLQANAQTAFGWPPGVRTGRGSCQRAS